MSWSKSNLINLSRADKFDNESYHYLSGSTGYTTVVSLVLSYVTILPVPLNEPK